MSRFLAAIAGAVLVSAAAPAADSLPGGLDSVTFYITDFGINQWRADLASGDDFSKTHNRVFGGFAAAAQVLIVMPGPVNFDTVPPARLVDGIREAVSRRVDDGLVAGVTLFELQLVSRVTTLQYMLDTRSSYLNRFGEVAYDAIGQVIAELKRGGREVRCIAVVGSNGARIFGQSILSWQPYLSEAWIFDGRMTRDEAVTVIGTLGQPNVRIFNIVTDWPVLLLPAPRLVSSHSIAKLLKRNYPRIRVYLLRPSAWTGCLTPGHLRGMSRPDTEFILREYDGDGYLPASYVTRRYLMPGILP